MKIRTKGEIKLSFSDSIRNLAVKPGGRYINNFGLYNGSAAGKAFNVS